MLRALGRAHGRAGKVDVRGVRKRVAPAVPSGQMVAWVAGFFGEKRVSGVGVRCVVAGAGLDPLSL